MGRGIVHIRCCRNVVGHKIAESCVKIFGNLVAQQIDTADMILPWAAEDIRSCYLGEEELESRTSIDNRWRTAADMAAVASPTAGM